MMSSMASISSSSSATVRVEKATSEFLMGPDWTMNIDICDTINTNQMLAKDVVKAVKKRLQHKNPKVQLLSLTLLETMVKNCGDYVHFQIAERSILQDMVKIVKKRTDMHVRDKVLTLIGSWHEAFGGSQGRYPQYYMAYEDLRRSGVEFPRVSPDAVPIFTPPVTHPISRPPQPGYGMPSSSSTRLDEVMAAEENFSVSSLNSMRDIMDLLTDMLQAVDPSDRKAVKDEVIVDLVGQCQVNQRKLVDMLASTGDEELLFQGLELNDRLQSVLAKHDAIASGSPLPSQLTDSTPEASEKNITSPKPVAEVSIANPPPAQIVPVQKAEMDEEEEEEDDFAQLARRHSKPRINASQNTANMALKEAPTGSNMSNALVPITSPAAVETKDQDIIDLLSLTLSTATVTEQQQTSETPMSTPMSHMHSQTQGQMPPASQGATFSAEPYHTNYGQTFNNYVAPWAQPQPQPQPPQTQYPQYTAYPPPPWAATPGYLSTPNPMLRPPQTYSMPGPTSSTYRPLQHESINNGQAHVYSGNNGQAQVYSGSTNVGQGQGQKPFIPSYRLFEDLNVLGNSNTDERYKGKGSSSNSLSGSSANQSMVGGRK